MKHMRWKAGVVVATGLAVGGCALLDVEHARREELRREFGSGQISQREYQQQLDQMERAKAEVKEAERKK